MRIIECSHAEHAGSILQILNEAIVNSTALYDYAPRPPESMVPWFETKRQRGFPVLGAVSDQGALLGFASYGTFRERPAYKYSVEHSVYVAPDQRGAGVGLALMRQLIAVATQEQLHVMVGGIDASNRASVALHEKLGFFHAGTVKHAGFKFGRWLDLAFYQLLLETPHSPVDG
jgi:L-amino acid N-acyltransferase